MFVCVYGRGVSRTRNSGADTGENSILVDLAFTFSPLVEQTTIDTIVLDVSGQDLLFGGASEFSESAEVESAVNIANEIFARSKHLFLKTNVAVAPNPDAAIHAARSFRGISLIAPGEELSQFGSVSIKKLDCSLAVIDEKRATELQETFALWGIRTFADLARLPLAGVAERLAMTSCTATEGLTCTVCETLRLFAASDTVSDWGPAVLSVAVNDPAPLVSVVSACKIA